MIAKTSAAGALADSAAAVVQQAQALSRTLHFTDGELASRYSTGWLLCNTGQPAAGQKAIQEALDHSRRLHNASQEALGWYYLGLTTASAPATMATRLSYFEQAARCYGQLHDLIRQAYCLKEVAEIHYNQGKYLPACQELLQVEALYRRSGTQKLHYTFELLGAAYTALGSYKKALQYQLAAIQNIKATRDTTAQQLAYAYDQTAITYQQLNQREKAIVYFRLALRQAEQEHQHDVVRQLVGAIAQNLVYLGRPQQALNQLLRVQRDFPPTTVADSVVIGQGLARGYLATRQYKLAATSCQLLKRQVEKLPNDDSHRLGPYLVLGKFYVTTHQYASARHYVSKALALCERINARNSLAGSYLLLFKVDSAQGRLREAIVDFQRYKAVQDAIFNEQNSKEVAGLQIEYDTRAKEQNIALLTKRNQMQRMTIRQREYQRNAFFVGAVLLVLVLGLGYNRYRLRQRSNRLLEEKQLLLEAQQAEISQKNQSLEQVVSEKDQLLDERQLLLLEKDWMLKEIHHRVKNNLQVVSSLLATQSRHLHDPQAQAAIRESENRVQVMAILHQKLYQADSIARVNMAEYGREIVTYLLQSFDHFHAVQTKLDLAAVELDATLATPLGLIINEAVTNALKYAFPSPRRGTITVSLICRAPQQYQLTIADDGVGLPPGFDLKRSRSLGMVIMKGLSRQLDGELAVSTAAGVHLTLQFATTKKPAYSEAG
ncbi:histidine kinase dimerization/phosphoacceptor domain -containing protein [Hymenobacter daeguensis]